MHRDFLLLSHRVKADFSSEVKVSALCRAKDNGPLEIRLASVSIKSCAKQRREIGPCKQAVCKVLPNTVHPYYTFTNSSSSDINLFVLEFGRCFLSGVDSRKERNKF